jgi:hypothetical protein
VYQRKSLLQKQLNYQFPLNRHHSLLHFPLSPLVALAVDHWISLGVPLTVKTTISKPAYVTMRSRLALAIATQIFKIGLACTHARMKTPPPTTTIPQCGCGRAITALAWKEAQCITTRWYSMIPSRQIRISAHTNGHFHLGAMWLF